jgi:hypothetical protein
MKDLKDFIIESIEVDESLKIEVLADPEGTEKDYIKVVAIDDNMEPIDEIGYVAIKDLGTKDDYKKWLPEVGKFFKKNHGLRPKDVVSLQGWDEDNEDWVQFAAVDGNGKVELWNPDAIDGEHPFK